MNFPALLETRLPIVRLKPDAPEHVKGLFGKIAAGSIAVAIKTADGYRVYYEGGIYSRHPSITPTREQQEEYAVLAAGRAVKRYPTVAFFQLESLEGLEMNGSVDVSRSPYEVLLPTR